MVRNYLTAEPAQLNSPAELMMFGNNSLEMVRDLLATYESTLPMSKTTVLPPISGHGVEDLDCLAVIPILICTETSSPP